MAQQGYREVLDALRGGAGSGRDGAGASGDPVPPRCSHETWTETEPQELQRAWWQAGWEQQHRNPQSHHPSLPCILGPGLNLRSAATSTGRSLPQGPAKKALLPNPCGKAQGFLLSAPQAMP